MHKALPKTGFNVQNNSIESYRSIHFGNALDFPFGVSSRLCKGFCGYGEVTEWLKVLAWNAGVVKATEGSNPSLTAIIYWTSTDTNILNDGRVPVTVDP